MIGIVIGKNRGYFEVKKTYEGKSYKSRFIQIEQVEDNGQVRIEKINVPDNPALIEIVKNMNVNENIELYVRFGVFNGFLTKKVVGV